MLMKRNFGAEETIGLCNWNDAFIKVFVLVQEDLNSSFFIK